MADFAKLTHVASEVEGNMLVGRLKDAGLQAFVQPSVSPVQGKLYTGELGMAASGADVCVAAERLEEAKGLLNQWNAIQPDEAELAAESEETGEIGKIQNNCTHFCRNYVYYGCDLHHIKRVRAVIQMMDVSIKNHYQLPC